MHLISRVPSVVAPLALVAALAACGTAERDQLRTELGTARSDIARLSGEVTTLSSRSAAEHEARVAAEHDAAAKAADLKTQQEKDKKEIDRLASHRDELKEWIEKELLPIAEAHDPKLVNLRDAAKDMGEEVEKTRGLTFKVPFMRRLITRGQVGEWMRRDLKKDMPEEDVRKMVTVGAEFGLLAPDTDVYAVFSDFMEGGAAAFYKPDTGTFYHIEGNDGRGARPVVFHELVHAVEDQYFHLDEFYKAVEKDGDMSLARRGLVEGSACHFASKYEEANPEDVKEMMKSQMKPELMQKQIKMIGTVPPFLIASFGLYPYKNAPDWLAKIGADDSAAIAKLYADPPVSTEQVLHPSKFPMEGPRDYPRKIETPDVAAVLGDGFENVEDNNMGELMTGLLLAQLQQGGKYGPAFLSVIDMQTQGVGFKGAAKTASEGWDGDRYTAWAAKGSSAVTIVWTSVWDTPEDAKEFYTTYGDLLGKRVLGKSFTTRPEVVRYSADGSGRVTGVELAGSRVVAVLGAPADKAEQLFAAGAAAKVTADPRDATDRD